MHTPFRLLHAVAGDGSMQGWTGSAARQPAVRAWYCMVLFIYKS
jgi:hypothetical protein